MPDEDAAVLFERCVAGDPDAQRTLYDRYVNRLIACCRARLSDHLRPRVAAEDVVQSAYRSFFRRTQQGDFRLGKNDDLWRLLAAFVKNKTRSYVEFHQAEKRDPRLEVRFTDSCKSAQQLMHDPTKDDSDCLIEELQSVMKTLSERDRMIMELRLRDVSTEEIAHEVGRAPRTVRRTLDKIYEALLRRLRS